VAVGDIGIWRDSTGSQLPPSAFGVFSYANEVRSDADYEYLGGSVQVQSAGTYLILWNINVLCTTTDRLNIEAGIQISNAWENLGNNGFDSGYSRNLDWPYSGVRNICVKTLSAFDRIRVAWRYKWFDATGGSIADYSELTIIRLPDATPHAYLGNPPPNSFNGTSWQNIGSYVNTDINDPASISYNSSTTEITLHGDQRLYLIGYAVVGASGGTRTQRISRARADGVDLPQSFGHCYQRDSATNTATVKSAFLFRSKAGGGDKVVAQIARGNADSDGSFAMNRLWSGLWAVELPDTAEGFLAHDSTGGQSINTASTTLNVARNQDFDSPSFSKVSNTSVRADTACNAIAICNSMGNRPTALSDVRNLRGTVGYVNSGALVTSVGMGYLRGYVLNESTRQIGMSTHFFGALNATDQVEFRSLSFGNTNGEASDVTMADRGSVALLNVDSLFTFIDGSGEGLTAEPTGTGTGIVTQHYGSGVGLSEEPTGEGTGLVALHPGSGVGLTGAPTGAGAGIVARHAGSGLGLTSSPIGQGSALASMFFGGGLGLAPAPTGEGFGVVVSLATPYEYFSRMVREDWGRLVGDPSGIHVNYDNDSTKPPVGTTVKAELRVMHDETEELSRHGPQTCYRMSARLRLRVFERIRTGDRRNVALIDDTIRTFQGRELNGVRYRSEGEVELRGRDTGAASWWQHILEIECTRDDFRAPAVSQGTWARMEIEAAQGAIREYFGAYTQDQLEIITIYDNDSSTRVPDVNTRWIRHSINLPAQTIPGEAGRSGTLLRVGEAVAQVFIPVADQPNAASGGGDRVLLQIADLITPRHSDVTIDGVRFGTAYLQSGGRDGAWWRGNVIMPFETVVGYDP
jgi:hypothetical protein